MENIKNLILDYGNVLFEIDFNRTQAAFRKLGIDDASGFFSHTNHDTLFNDFETGAITSAQFRDGIRKAANNFHLTDEAIDAAWNSLLIGIAAPEVHELLFTLRKKYRLFLLSNNNEIHYNWIIQYLKTTFNIENYDAHFEKAYFSHQMDMRKPNVEIFQKVLVDNSLHPKETLFIDDSPQHIAGAKAAGLHTLLMDAHPRNFEDFLKKHDVL